jgi:hypothetical protein
MAATTENRTALTPGRDRGGCPLEVFVLFTTVPETLAALRAAGRLAQGLAGRIRLLVPHVVPYPLPIEKPPADSLFLLNRFRVHLEEAEVETSVDVRLCRDPWDGICQALPRRSIVVIGGYRRWWGGPRSGMVKHLQKAGHHVVLPGEK